MSNNPINSYFAYKKINNIKDESKKINYEYVSAYMTMNSNVFYLAVEGGADYKAWSSVLEKNANVDPIKEQNTNRSFVTDLVSEIQANNLAGIIDRDFDFDKWNNLSYDDNGKILYYDFHDLEMTLIYYFKEFKEYLLKNYKVSEEDIIKVFRIAKEIGLAAYTNSYDHFEIKGVKDLPSDFNLYDFDIHKHIERKITDKPIKKNIEDFWNKYKCYLERYSDEYKIINGHTLVKILENLNNELEKEESLAPYDALMASDVYKEIIKKISKYYDVHFLLNI